MKKFTGIYSANEEIGFFKRDFKVGLMFLLFYFIFIDGFDGFDF